MRPPCLNFRAIVLGRRSQFGIWLKIFLFGGFSTFYLQNVVGFWWGAANRSSNCCNIVNLLEKPRKYAK